MKRDALLPKRGMAIVVVLIILTTTVVCGLGLHFYSLSTRNQVARASYGTLAEYLCEAACEEGFYLAQRAMNDSEAAKGDFEGLYERIRNPNSGDFELEYSPKQVIEVIEEKKQKDFRAEFPRDSIKASMRIEFDGPFSTLSSCRCEYGGKLVFEASIKPSWGSGFESYRRVVVRRGFKVVLISPPHPFDKSALSIIHPDYINGSSKSAMDAEIFQATNQAIDQHNSCCRLYRQIYKTAKKVIPTKCDTCATLPYISGNPPFLAPRIPDSAKIPADFFFADSVLISQPNRKNLEKLADFNYEDFLRERWQPLFNFYKSLSAISSMNGSLLAVTSAVLACIPPTSVNTAASIVGIGAVLEAVHKILQVVVPIQFALGQSLLAAQKIVLEGFIVGQLFYQTDQAMQGNFQPSIDGAATFAGDLAASGVFDAADEAESGLEGIEESTQGQEITGEAIESTEEGVANVDAQALEEAVESAREENFSGFEGQLEEMRNLEGMESQISGLGNSLAQLFSNSEGTQGVTPLGEMASDSDLSMLTGLIKGFVLSHRRFFTLEFEAGSSGHGKLRRCFAAFEEDLWRKKATFFIEDQQQCDDLFEQYAEEGLCGIVFYSGEGPLKLSVDDFRGRAIVYSSKAVELASIVLEDRERDCFTVISKSTITLTSKNVSASLNAVGSEDSRIEFIDGVEIFGNILLSHYRVSDQRNRRQNPFALKGSLILNERLNQRESNGLDVKASHLRVILSPGIQSQEVLVTE